MNDDKEPWGAIGPGTHAPDVHLNLSVRGLSQSATLAINDRCEAMRREGRPVFRFGLGQSPFPVPPPVVEELRSNAHRKEYLPARGLRELRESVADYLRRAQSIPVRADQILVGPGSKELMFLLQISYYGDLVIPTPAWVSYAPQARIVGRPVRWIHTRSGDGWKLPVERLAELCEEENFRPRILVLNYPGNPTGGTYSSEELQALAAVAREHRVIVLSDEIYGELHHQGRHVSIGRFYPEGTILSSGLSKWCGAGGWRLGVFAFPESLSWLRTAMTSVASETYTSTSAPIQYAAVRAFEGGMRIERYLRNSRRILAALDAWIEEKLRGAGVDTAPAQGAFYLFPDFRNHRDAFRERGIVTAKHLCARLLEETGVALLPGVDFGRPADELTARLAYVDFDGARALAAAEALPPDADLDEAFLRTYCPNVLGGMDRLGEWVGAA